jgi:hypothetical protein
MNWHHNGACAWKARKTALPTNKEKQSRFYLNGRGRDLRSRLWGSSGGAGHSCGKSPIWQQNLIRRGWEECKKQKWLWYRVALHDNLFVGRQSFTISPINFPFNFLKWNGGARSRVSTSNLVGKLCSPFSTTEQSMFWPGFSRAFFCFLL